MDDIDYLLNSLKHCNRVDLIKFLYNFTNNKEIEVAEDKLFAEFPLNKDQLLLLHNNAESFLTDLYTFNFYDEIVTMNGEKWYNFFFNPIKYYKEHITNIIDFNELKNLKDDCCYNYSLILFNYEKFKQINIIRNNKKTELQTVFTSGLCKYCKKEYIVKKFPLSTQAIFLNCIRISISERKIYLNIYNNEEK
ncbi:hypothetical protein SGHV011 [Glossina pallidipes salivary gland hypertrophy virus]|uniref:Uncharacterized protein n=1 Tax=Glossina hytrovirus (isolate Glossina pallidipes/Ethiopia/Seibersdorf/-) TaxID=379529 RepID=B0YLG5_GHVS|nr:hypothetical protein SGHV011 [Glossina pallidipes salivary gland hypertrophy virus]ABQ08784.1 hypothetical protein SGHV011 [Glossina pallidipes salivary gland hypertrophy virus]